MNFRYGCLMTSGDAPPRPAAIAHGHPKVSPNGREAGGIRKAAAGCVLVGTTSVAITGAAAGALTGSPSAVPREAVSVVLTGAAAGALSGTAALILNGAAAWPAVPERVRGPPHRSAAEPPHRPACPARPALLSRHTRTPQTTRRADGSIHRPDFPRKPFRCKERDDVESHYFTSETHSLVASPSRSRWHPCTEPDP
jgi:hypothetical protein